MATGAPTKRDVTTTTGASAGTSKGGSGKDANSDGDEGAPEKKGKLKLILIVVVVMLALGAGAYFMFLKPSGPTKPPTPQAGKIIQMDATTLNLADGHYLKLQVALELTKDGTNPSKAKDVQTEETFETNEASEIVINEFSNRPVTDMDSAAKRDAIKADLLAKLQEQYNGAVHDLYFITFVTQ